MTKPQQPKPVLTHAEIAAAQRLAAAIKASGRTQQAIADEIGVSQGAVWQWAHAKMRVPADRALALAQVLGIEDPGSLSPHWAETIGNAHVSVSSTGAATITIGPPPRQPDPALLGRAISEAAAAFRRARLLPSDEQLSAAAVSFYQDAAAGVALTASRRALDDSLKKAITDFQPKQE